MHYTEAILSTLCLSLVGALVYALFRLRSYKAQASSYEEAKRGLNHELNLYKKKVERVTEEKNQVMGIVSHDLKSPFNRIYALNNLIKMEADNLNQNQREHLDRIQNVVSESLVLIRNMLDIRSIEFKGLELNFRELSARKSVMDVLKTYKSVLEQKKQKLKLTFISEEEMHYLCDAQSLKRIIDNLVSNAVKYTAISGKIQVILEEDADSFSLRIIDEGPGIAEEEQSKLFKKYTILSSKPTGHESSTGLGLAVVKSFVNLLKGEVYYKTQLGEGSEFGVRIPNYSGEPGFVKMEATEKKE